MSRFPSERSRGGRLAAAMRRFSKVIDDLALRDLPLQGVHLLGMVVLMGKLCQDWIFSWCLRTGKVSSVGWCKALFPYQCLITILSF